MAKDLEKLLKVTSLLKERALETYRSDVAEERGHVKEYRQIDAMHRASITGIGQSEAQRMLGADQLWRGWLGKRRGELNQEIAKSRAKQGHSIVAARHAFSQHEAALSMDRANRKQVCERRDASEEDAIEALVRMSWFDLND